VKIHYQNGHPIKIWELPRHRRNEALDTAVYGHAAAVILNPLFRQITAKMQRLRDGQDDGASAEPTRRRRDSGDYINSWRN
jgi:phage terminase large subunit GpA-like protein